MGSLICLRIVILNFVQVMNWLRGFRLIMKCLIPFFLGVIKRQVKNPLFCRPSSIVLLGRIVSNSKDITISWASGIFTLHICDGFIRGGFWFKCSRCPCTVPNMKGSWVIHSHLSTNSHSLPPIRRTDHCGLGSNPFLCAPKSHGLGSMAFCPGSLLLNAFWAVEHGLRRPTFWRLCFSRNGHERLFWSLLILSISSLFSSGCGGTVRLFFCVFQPLCFISLSFSSFGGLVRLPFEAFDLSVTIL